MTTGGVRVDALGWGWRHAGRKARALSDVTVTIQPGERVLLLGRSGAGKSTFLHALAGVLGGAEEGEQHGRLLVDGEPPASRRGSVGLLMQDPDSQIVLSRVGDDVAFGPENLGVPREAIWRRVRDCLASVGLDVPLESSTAALSGGQKQRLALAGILALRPGLLLLDEPTANLDPAGVVEVRDAVARVLDETESTLVVVEHRVEVWLNVVNRVIVLDSTAGVVADGPPEQVLTAQADDLAAAGVWVPGRHCAPPREQRNSSAPVLLSAEALAVERSKREPLGHSLDFTVQAGRALAITGPNGAGKSTLALTLAGLLRPAAGAFVAADSLAGGLGTQPIRWRARDLLTRIGTVFQESEHQFLTTTVRAELEVGPRALGLAEDETRARIDDLLERLRLTALAAAHPFTLSGGEKRRLSVATVLASRPRVVILDEPTFGQDARTWRELVELLGSLLSDGHAVVAVTHDDDFVGSLADEVIELPAYARASAAL
ncbi:ABC transporter ATP-binding protein [Mycobacterium sp. DL592]|uniref:ABC transporter ATP-binding protein n=1 Tax=Mycobacterium sp. DL592 TaxID=2675524 RepID=UPI0014203BD1|nr:ABC transporter ATP-binding protein [Mycobacterium sp. DL592]